MNIVQHGSCDFCGAADLLFARPVDSDTLFFVCAACGHGATVANGNYFPIADIAHSVAANGWMLAVATDVPDAESVGKVLDTQKSNNYQSLIAHYSGLILRGPGA